MFGGGGDRPGLATAPNIPRPPPPPPRGVLKQWPDTNPSPPHCVAWIVGLSRGFRGPLAVGVWCSRRQVGDDR